MQRSALCRSRRELSNEYLLAKIGVDTAENEPLEVWGENSIQYSLQSLDLADLFPQRVPVRDLADAGVRDGLRTDAQPVRSLPCVEDLYCAIALLHKHLAASIDVATTEAT